MCLLQIQCTLPYQRELSAVGNCAVCRTDQGSASHLHDDGESISNDKDSEYALGCDEAWQELHGRIGEGRGGRVDGQRQAEIDGRRDENWRADDEEV